MARHDNSPPKKAQSAENPAGAAMNASEAAPAYASDGREALQRQGALGQRLKALYDEVADEPLPNDFIDLLARLSDAPDGGERS